MFELDKYEAKLHNERPAAPAEPYEPASNVKEMSLLFWGEHCVECAAPACYQSCDLYQPRPDKRCRRFAFGAYKNRNFASLRGYGVEVTFKKWAKIEASGNLSLSPTRSVLWRERIIQWGSPLANFLGRVIGKFTENINWDSVTYIALGKLARRINRPKPESSLPDVFLLEVYNPTPEVVRLQLNFAQGSEGLATSDLLQLGPSFVKTVTLPKGYSRHEIELSLLRSVVASRRSFRVSMIPEADSNARLVFLTADFVRFTERPAAATEATKVKCVVWDLDNTLWRGILIEGDDVVLNPEIVRLLKHLDERGVLLSIASKNDYASAWAKLEQLGISEYFVYPQISWAPKSTGIGTIAERLNIGRDTFAFVDDNPFELNEVSRALPEVLCVNATDISTLCSDPRFRGSTSAESRHRRQFYQEAMAREEAQQQFGSNYLEFLRSCGITLDIVPYRPEDSERVTELVQRTNQLNFSGHKYTRDQLNEILASAQLEKYVLKSSDTYGSYGTIGFGIVEHGTGIIQIRDFMLSCRVQGKFIEQAFFYHLVDHHNPQSAETLWVNFRETTRNKPAQQVLESLGFRKCSPASERLLEGMLHSSLDSLRCDFIQVRCSAASSGLPKVPVVRAETAIPR